MSDKGHGPYLLFELGSLGDRASAADAYAMDVADVLQVVEIDSVEEVPLSPPLIEGIANYHGRILTVVDPAGLLGLELQPQPVSQVVILRFDAGGRMHIGFKIARVGDIVSGDDLEEAGVPPGPVVDWVGKYKGQLIQVIEGEALVSTIGMAFGNEPNEQRDTQGVGL